VHEAIPLNAPQARSKDIDLTMYIYSDNAGDKQNRRSSSALLIYMISALLMWLPKKHATIETSVFGAEFVAMKVSIETLQGLQYKLRMMGVVISGPTHIYGDIMSVIQNTQKHKSNAICYHVVGVSIR